MLEPRCGQGSGSTFLRGGAFKPRVLLQLPGLGEEDWIFAECPKDHRLRLSPKCSTAGSLDLFARYTDILHTARAHATSAPDREVGSSNAVVFNAAERDVQSFASAEYIAAEGTVKSFYASASSAPTRPRLEYSRYHRRALLKHLSHLRSSRSEPRHELWDCRAGRSPELPLRGRLIGSIPPRCGAVRRPRPHPKNSPL